VKNAVSGREKLDPGAHEASKRIFRRATMGSPLYGWKLPKCLFDVRTVTPFRTRIADVNAGGKVHRIAGAIIRH
jgi:hypothetical protein